jgi:hypothetical protein
MGTDPEVERRKKLTFAQAEGLEPLPAQLALTEVSQELRAVLWNFIHEDINQSSTRGAFEPYLTDPWSRILKRAHVYHEHRLIDEFSGNLGDALDHVKQIFEKGSYGWLQFVIRVHNNRNFTGRISQILRYARAPYRIVDESVICPIVSDAEAATVSKAFTDLANTQLTGARKHLRKAAAELTQGHFADSVRESIHAVESVARYLEPTGELSGALARLENSAKIHGAMKKGFSALYGYTSDSQGIRHALLDKDAPEVDEQDALFMIGACAAFVSYLVGKARNAGLFSVADAT